MLTVAPLNPERMRRPHSIATPTTDVCDGRAYEIMLLKHSKTHVALIAGISVDEVDRRIQAAKDHEQKQ